MFSFLELKLFIHFAVFAILLDILLLTVLVISWIDDGFQFRVSRLHIFSLLTEWEKIIMLSINFSCERSTDVRRV